MKDQLNTIEDVRAWVQEKISRGITLPDPVGEHAASVRSGYAIAFGDLLDALPEPQPASLHFETLDDVREWVEGLVDERDGTDDSVSMTKLREALKPRRTAHNLVCDVLADRYRNTPSVLRPADFEKLALDIVMILLCEGFLVTPDTTTAADAALNDQVSTP